MGRQINFYLHPEDYKDFEDILYAHGNIVLLPYYHYDNIIRTVPTTIPVDIQKEGSRIYLVRESDVKQVTLKHIETLDYWLVNDLELPVLHYDRCTVRNDKLTRGRLYFQPQFVKNMQSVNKSAEFVSWADNIIKTAKRKLKKYKFDMGYAEYVGKKTQQWLDKTKQESGKTDSDLISVN